VFSLNRNILKTLGYFGVSFGISKVYLSGFSGLFRQGDAQPVGKGKRTDPARWFAVCCVMAISGSQVRALLRPPSSLREPALLRRQAGKSLLRPFLAISSSHFSVSVESIRSLGRFRPAGLRPQKSRSRRGWGAEAGSTQRIEIDSPHWPRGIWVDERLRSFSLIMASLPVIRGGWVLSPGSFCQLIGHIGRDAASQSRTIA
jgi:hypothetical protein